MRYRLAVVALLLTLLTASCDFVPFTANGDLLTAPMLNREQAEVSSALSRLLNLSDIVYKYPQGGEYRSPFVFTDLDGDGLREVIVFYAYTSAPSELRAKLLRQSESGEWYSFHDLTGSGDTVDFVQFTSFYPDEQSLVVGWQNTDSQQCSLGVYTLRDSVEQDLLERHAAQLVYDFDGDGLSEIVLAQRETEGFALRLLRAQSGHLVDAARYPLYESTTGVLQLLYGRLWDSTYGIYIDEKIENSFYATEVFRINGRLLTPVSYGGFGRDAPEWTDFAATFRDEDILSVDLAQDGTIEVPRVQWMPGAEPLAGTEAALPPLVQYMRLEQSGFHVRFNAVINAAAGYMVFYPDQWLTSVTLVESTEMKEWSFRKYDVETDRTGAELFRVRVYSAEDYFDQLPRDEMLLATRGIFQYCGYVPELPDEPLAITPAQAQELFALLEAV